MVDSKLKQSLIKQIYYNPALQLNHAPGNERWSPRVRLNRFKQAVYSRLEYTIAIAHAMVEVDIQLGCSRSQLHTVWRKVSDLYDRGLHWAFGVGYIPPGPNSLSSNTPGAAGAGSWRFTHIRRCMANAPSPTDRMLDLRTQFEAHLLRAHPLNPIRLALECLGKLTLWPPHWALPRVRPGTTSRGRQYTTYRDGVLAENARRHGARQRPHALLSMKDWLREQNVHRLSYETSSVSCCYVMRCARSQNSESRHSFRPKSLSGCFFRASSVCAAANSGN